MTGEINLQQARVLILDQVDLGTAEGVELDQALFRRSFEPLKARRPLPHFRQAAMDGFALASAGLAQAQDWHEFVVVAEAAAGATEKVDLGTGEACRIMTGALVPADADMVVPFEWCREKDGVVQVPARLGANSFVRSVGADLARGRTIIGRGRRLMPVHLQLLASAGYRQVKVFARPEVAFICTGSELVMTDPEPGQIISGNRLLLTSLIQEGGGQPRDLGTVVDSVSPICRALQDASSARMVITTGGMGPGKYDLLHHCYQEVGIKILYRSLKVRPGRATIFGVKDGTMFFGLPGPPPAAHLLFRELVRPALLAMQGDVRRRPVRIRAILAEEIKMKRRGLVNLKGGIIDFVDDKMTVRTAGLTEQAMATIIVPAHRRCLRKGEMVSVHLSPS